MLRSRGTPTRPARRAIQPRDSIAGSLVRPAQRANVRPYSGADFPVGVLHPGKSAVGSFLLVSREILGQRMIHGVCVCSCILASLHKNLSEYMAGAHMTIVYGPLLVRH
jgi:hypothetical protein